MDKNTTQVIDELFQRIEQAMQQNPNRDRDAESLIEKHVIHQPCAPYYMAQTIVMQNATMKQLQAQVEQLQQQLNQQQTRQGQSGGFFSRLFGAEQHNHANSQSQWQQPDYQQARPGSRAYGAQPQYAGGGFGRGSSFLGGALQTAAGVAGGMVLGNMMMNMFSHRHPEEIINIINDDPASMNPDMDSAFNPDAMADNDVQDADFNAAGNDFTPQDNMTDNNFGQADFNDNTFADSNIPDGQFGSDPFNNGFGSGFDNNSGFDDFGGGFDDGGFDDFDDFS